MKIIEGRKFPVNFMLWGMNPLQIEEEDRQELKSPYHMMQLRYAAMELITSEFIDWEDHQFTRDEVEDAASICDDSLYLNDFEGYRLSEFVYLKYLYMNKENRMCAALYDEETDDFTYWNIY